MRLLSQLHQMNKKCHKRGKTGHYANEIAKCKAATEKVPKNLLG